ncbi:hypothetical protein JTB14_018854 [Gonioctena quinquepunctata]|nr:hypothetical protein JTB14_018854 [Gonioctena quinquepunctata]
MFETSLTFGRKGVTAMEDYWKKRANLLQKDRFHALGGAVQLNEKEKKVNEMLMNYKYKEYDAGFADPDTFLAAKHIFEARKGIEQSKVFNVIKKLPKGGSLHSHDLALVSQEFVYNLTYRNDLYGCVVDGKLRLHFFDKNNIGQDCNWTLMSELRKSDPKFDDFVKSKLTLICDDPKKSYPDLNKVWIAFVDIFGSILNMLCYKPVWQDYFYQALKELYEDNVMYLELRGFLPPVYDLNGRTYDEVEVVGLYYETLKKFKEDYPDFHDAKFIYAPHRKADNKTMDHYADTFGKLKKAYPEFVIGFDLVGQEDLGFPLTSHIPQLQKMKKDYGANFFFHAGETNWNGQSTDFNLIDAIMLDTTRIGHGYAILKHPSALRLIKEKGIAIEICPISNQVLMLVDDIRNHPGSFLIANDYPVVIAPDDPSFWGVEGLSYDWYMAFMAMASRESDLGFLKQLARNSIQYSGLSTDEKVGALEKWKNDWNEFIDGMTLTRCSADVAKNMV